MMKVTIITLLLAVKIAIWAYLIAYQEKWDFPLHDGQYLSFLKSLIPSNKKDSIAMDLPKLATIDESQFEELTATVTSTNELQVADVAHRNCQQDTSCLIEMLTKLEGELVNLNNEINGAHQ